MMRKAFLSLFFFFFISCGKTRYFYDFSYTLSEKNIKESPYSTLYSNLSTYGETLNDWKPLMEIKEKRLKIWASTTSFPVLNLYMKNLKGLTLYFNGKKLKATPFEKFFGSPPFSYTVKREHIRLNPTDSKYKKSLTLKSSKNLVLLSLPEDIKPVSAKITYQTIFNEKNISYDFSSFLLRREDYERVKEYKGEKPWNLVKKLNFADQTWTAIFAPPRTVLEFPVEISEESIFDFGYFIQPLEMSKSNVYLSIYFISGKKKVALFQKVVSLSEEPDIHFGRIEVGKLSKGKGKIFLLTDKKIKTPVIVAWINPHLYIKRGLKKTAGIILISLDSMRRDYVGVYSGERAITPEIDRLAEDSVVFENAYAHSSWTLPSHASILTGLFPVNHFTNTLNDMIPDSILTLPQILKEKGFINFAYTGDGLVSSRFGFCKGFDQYKEWEGMELPDSSTPIYRRASDFLSNNKGKNFFLFLHTMQFHSPLHSPDDVKEEVFKGKKMIWDNLYPSEHFKKRGERPFTKEEIENIKLLYKAEAKTIDKHLIGPLIKKLKEEGLYDKTMIILTSDHGEEIMEHGRFQHGYSLYNESIRVPLIIKFPDQKFKGKRITKNVGHVDLAPTILDFFGIDPSKYRMDGESLIPVIKGKDRRERPIFSEIYYQEERPNIPPCSAVVLGDFKLIITGKISKNQHFHYELYNLSKDPGEKKNIRFENQKIFETLRELINEYKKKDLDLSKKSEIPDELRKRLKSLGYLQ